MYQKKITYNITYIPYKVTKPLTTVNFSLQPFPPPSISDAFVYLLTLNHITRPFQDVMAARHGQKTKENSTNFSLTSGWNTNMLCRRDIHMGSMAPHPVGQWHYLDILTRCVLRHPSDLYYRDYSIVGCVVCVYWYVFLVQLGHCTCTDRPKSIFMASHQVCSDLALFWDWQNDKNGLIGVALGSGGRCTCGHDPPTIYPTKDFPHQNPWSNQGHFYKCPWSNQGLWFPPWSNQIGWKRWRDSWLQHQRHSRQPADRDCLQV